MVRSKGKYPFVPLIDSSMPRRAPTSGPTAVRGRVVELQDRITESVVGALWSTLREAEIMRARRKRPASLGAYDYVLRALPLVIVNTVAEAAPAAGLLEEALRLQPDHGHDRPGPCSGGRWRAGSLSPGLVGHGERRPWRFAPPGTCRVPNVGAKKKTTVSMFVLTSSVRTA
jgi:hypothetical protein